MRVTANVNQEGEFVASPASGDFARLAKCLALGAQSDHALAHAERAGASGRVLAVLKAPAGAASTGDPEWASGLAAYRGLASAFISSIRPESLFYSVCALAVPAPMRARLVATAMILADTARPEAGWIPVAQGLAASSTLAPSHAAALIVVTRELLEATDAASFAALNREITAGLTAAVDRAFWAIATAGITPIAATADPLADLRALLDVVNTTGGGRERMLAAMHPSVANAASTVADLAGARLFPTMTPFGGALVGIEALVTDTVPPGTLALLNAAGFAMNEGVVATDVASSASVQMVTDPVSGATETVSMFQTHSAAIRATARFGAARVRDSAVAILSGVSGAWGAEVAS